jgi:N-acetylmuramic acid 6-phosphate (MurNAc-6-P) etherase
MLRGGNADTLVIVSASGRTPDCRRAIVEGLARGITRLVIVSSVGIPEMIDEIVIQQQVKLEIISVKSKDRGFISFAGTISPALLFSVASGLDMIEAARLF